MHVFLQAIGEDSFPPFTHSRDLDQRSRDFKYSIDGEKTFMASGKVENKVSRSGYFSLFPTFSFTFAIRSLKILQLS